VRSRRWERGHEQHRHKMTSGDATWSDGVTGSGVWVPMEIALKGLTN
jgi:hypothetical protein